MRLIVVINFFLVGVCLLPGARDVVALIFRALEHYPPLPWLFDAWVVASTLYATGILALRYTRLLKGAPGDPPDRGGVALDAGLLLAWWLVLIGASMFAFMLGMGG